MPQPLTKAIAHRSIVLVVDDTPTSLGVLCEMLESAGYAVLIASDAEAALRCLLLAKPDIILMDVLTPGYSGFEVCRRIKSNLATKHIPVIFMTGLSDTAHVLEAFACGGVDYLTKPLRTLEVLARIRIHLNNSLVTRFALDALDMSGLGVVMLDQQGVISWCSTCAKQLLMQFGFQVESAILPRSWWDGGSDMKLLASNIDSANVCLVLRNFGTNGMGEIMLLLELNSHHMLSPDRLIGATLTPREAEVLFWLAKGKTNRDIGDILQLSPRTVSKHLEHIFEKLGVETRSAAVSMASALEHIDARQTTNKWSH